MDDEDATRMRRSEEKHEALARSLELLHHDIRLQGGNIDKLAIESAGQRELVGQVLSAMRELIGVGGGHERRIQKLEDR